MELFEIIGFIILIILIFIALSLFTLIIYKIYRFVFKILNSKNIVKSSHHPFITKISISLPFIATIIIATLLYIYKDYRTPSHEVIYDISGIQLPTPANVIEDKYTEMWQDYAITYKVQLNNKESSEISGQIVSSEIFDKKIICNDEYCNNVDEIAKNTENAKWYKFNKGYKFFMGKKNNFELIIEFDTTTRIFYFSEFKY